MNVLKKHNLACIIFFVTCNFGTGTLKSLKENELFGLLFEKEGGETKTIHELRISL
jgi:hypothetical protein